MLKGQEMASEEEVTKVYFGQTQLHFGKSNVPNAGFPELRPQLGLSVVIGRTWQGQNLSWVRALKSPKTGLCVGYTHLGNKEHVGQAYSLMPFIETNLGSKDEGRWSASVGYGASYISKKYNVSSNSFNRAISTHVNWTFRSFLYWKALRGEEVDWRMGIGYIHHSNGHTRLPNQGFNSFLLSLSTELHSNKKSAVKAYYPRPSSAVTKRIGIRTGRGLSVFSLAENELNNVTSLTFNYGLTWKSTLRLGFNVNFKHYEYYRNFIKDNQLLVAQSHAKLKEAPFLNSMAIGFGVESEFIMGHIGAQLDLGFNVFKPAYVLDWKINEGHYSMYREEYIYGELDWYYRLKKRVSSRLALNYYLVHSEKNARINVYLSAALNANLGQADFSELSLGMIHTLR